MILRLFLLLTFVLLRLQPLTFAYNAPVTFASEAQYVVASTTARAAVISDSAAPVLLCLDRDRATSASQVNLRLTVNFIAAEGVAANVAPRALTAADLGVDSGALTTLDGTYSVTNGTATAQINMIQGNIRNPFQIIGNLSRTAAADGASTLQIQGTVANERLYNILVKRYGMTSQGAIDTIIISLK